MGIEGVLSLPRLAHIEGVRRVAQLKQGIFFVGFFLFGGLGVGLPFLVLCVFLGRFRFAVGFLRSFLGWFAAGCFLLRVGFLFVAAFFGAWGFCWRGGVRGVWFLFCGCRCVRWRFWLGAAFVLFARFGLLPGLFSLGGAGLGFFLLVVLFLGCGGFFSAVACSAGGGRWWGFWGFVLSWLLWGVGFGL